MMDWRYYREFESRYQKKLSLKDNAAITAELYDFARRVGKRVSKSLAVKKTLHLAKIHSILNRVKI